MDFVRFLLAYLQGHSIQALFGDCNVNHLLAPTRAAGLPSMGLHLPWTLTLVCQLRFGERAGRTTQPRESALSTLVWGPSWGVDGESVG
jgi:hypothetical protein